VQSSTFIRCRSQLRWFWLSAYLGYPIHDNVILFERCVSHDGVCISGNSDMEFYIAIHNSRHYCQVYSIEHATSAEPYPKLCGCCMPQC
jgi:hypothetical protein